MSAPLTVLVPLHESDEFPWACVRSLRDTAAEILLVPRVTAAEAPLPASVPALCRWFPRAWTAPGELLPWALKTASQPWLLWLRPDERMTKPAACELQQTLSANTGRVTRYQVAFAEHLLGQPLRWSTLRGPQVRLFRTRTGQEGTTGKLRNRLVWNGPKNYDHYFAQRIQESEFEAREMRKQGMRPTRWTLGGRPWWTFLRTYLLQGGCLEGALGLQACFLHAFAEKFLTQGRLWEQCSAIPQPDPEAEWAAERERLDADGRNGAPLQTVHEARRAA